MKLVGQILLSLLAGLAGLIVTSLIVVQVQTAIHDDQAFEHDAGANFALGMLMLAFALPAAFLCCIFVFHRVRYKRWYPRI